MRCSSQLATRFAWVISAALGAPVVPEVYWSSAVSDFARGAGDASAGESRRISRSASVPGNVLAGARKEGGGGSAGSLGRKSQYAVTAIATRAVRARNGST